MTYTAGVEVPVINTIGLIFITYTQARKHKAEVKEIMRRLRASGAFSNDTPAREMKWEYVTVARMDGGHGSNVDLAYETVLKGRARNWWSAIRLGWEE